jgi:hypothetical protein
MEWSTIREATREDWDRLVEAAERFVANHDVLDAVLGNPVDDVEAYLAALTQADSPYRQAGLALKRQWRRAVRRALRCPTADGIEFVRRALPQFADAPVMASVTAADVAGACVAGNLPLDLAAQACVVYAITFAGQPPRGQEYNLADMDAAGARIQGFVVITYEEEE